MKKILVPFILLSAIGCTVNIEVTEPEKLVQKVLTITATSGEPDTRTERASDGSVLWSPGDQISLFFGSGSNGGNVFTSQNTETARVAQFTGSIGVITGGNEVSMGSQYFWAVYPYNASASCDGTSITTVLPSEQVATADTFADDLFPTMGRSTGLSMAFFNICGGIKFTVSESGITSVTLQGNSGEQLAGTINACFDDNGLPSVTSITAGSNTITLSAPEGTTFQVGRAYYFVFVPTVFENGFTLTFEKDDNSTAVYNRTSKTTIRRSVFGSLNTPDSGLTWQAYTPYVVSFQASSIGEYPYSFYTQSWGVALSSVSSAIESVLMMDYASFRDSFTWVEDKTFFYKNGMVECTGSNDYGSVLFEKNGSASSINDTFTISLSREQEDNFDPGTTKTLYAQFVSAKNDRVYIGFSLKIGAKPTASFTSKNTGYWYSDVNNEPASTIRSHVAIPQYYDDFGGDDVTQYAITIDDYWSGGNVTVNVSPALPANMSSQVRYKYEFSQTQPRAGAGNRAITRSSATSLNYNGSTIISLLDQGTGRIKYNYNDVSKELINWASNPSDEYPNSRLLYCNVDLVAYYTNADNTNYVELGRQTIHVRFLRPVTLNVNNTYHLTDGVPGNGDTIGIGRLFGAEDWQGYKLFWYDESYGGCMQGMYSGVSYFGYYHLYTISINLDKVATNQSQPEGTYVLLSYVNANAKVGAMYQNGSGYINSGVFSVDITSASNLDNFVLTYRNSMGYAEDYTIRVPVSLEYAWGAIDAYVYINIYGTAHNSL